MKDNSVSKNLLWLKCSQAIRKALEAFWTGLRDFHTRDLKKSDFSADEVHNLLKTITLSANLSSEYVDAAKTEEQDVLASIECATTVPIQKEWGSHMTTESAVPVPKPKSKTCPAQATGATKGHGRG